jgi:hypothetical protein
MEDFDYDIDLQGRSLTVFGLEPRTVPLPEDVLPAGVSQIEHIAVRPSEGYAVVRLPGSVDATIELRLGRTAPDALVGRRVVYLDQNHWSTLSAWRIGSDRVTAENAAAAERLVDLAQAGQVVLPVSAGHLVETTPLFDEPRVARAGTLLEVSRGWQMRNPVHVRSDELRLGIVGHDSPRATDVFAPGADELFSLPRSRVNLSDLPEPFAELGSELVPALAIAEALVDRNAIPDEGGEAMAASWAAKFQRLAEHLRSECASPRRIREVGHGMFLADLADELLAISRDLGLSPDALLSRLPEKGEPVRSMPYLSRARGTLTLRMSNPNQKWEPNDLIDIQFLTCAAGYADVVVGERQTIDYLRRVEDVPEGGLLPKRWRRPWTCLKRCWTPTATQRLAKWVARLDCRSGPIDRDQRKQRHVRRA